ncbi:hypothetical protein E0500_038305 [Streptomyces sp. KM273126]|uniref:hypothetical protein n=1 Tax=Streptomyces sp. KM273126 TaxID=2545247 RepID=UPI00103B6BEB|nr:hypothetical protein [Streptomyces sp. KM273126]MBA2813018.1 hypothetical protein [Streptomyces sp. KM273126]
MGDSTRLWITARPAFLVHARVEQPRDLPILDERGVQSVRPASLEPLHPLLDVRLGRSMVTVALVTVACQAASGAQLLGSV